MEKKRSNDVRLLLLNIVCLALINRGVAAIVTKQTQFTRFDFPSDFIFGASTSAYQVEGAAAEDGRTPSIFDTYAHQTSYETYDPDITCDQYHKYKEDVQLMVETGLDAYRLSISWSRLIPNGRGSVNPKGLRYYNNIINELTLHGIEPHVSLMHSDFPQVLEDEYGGFVSPRVIEDFTAYADVCFREFGDRVKYWTTINEANIFVFGGYDVGVTPPGRCSSPFGSRNCTKGNSTTEPYLAAHHLLLAHASAVRLYRNKYQAQQLGFVGFNLLTYHFSPNTTTRKEMIAAQQAYDYFIGWFMHPLTYGDYPKIMKKNAGTRIPIFTKEQSNMVKGSSDFIGVNYYHIMGTKDNSMSLSTKNPRDYYADMTVLWDTVDPTSGKEEDNMYKVEPWGLERVLEYFQNVYQNPPIFIHENGQKAPYNTSTYDPFRIEYLHAYISSLLKAVRNGSNTKGYFVWSLLDLYELTSSFDSTYGLYYVDFTNPNLSRYPKLSQRWYSTFLKGNNTSFEIENNLFQDNFRSTS